MAIVQENDAAGGAGSIAQDLLGIAIGGLSRTIDGVLAKKYPLTSFNERSTLNAQGQVQPAGAPQGTLPASNVWYSAFQNPVVMAVTASVGIGVLVLIVVAIARK